MKPLLVLIGAVIVIATLIITFASKPSQKEATKVIDSTQSSESSKPKILPENERINKTAVIKTNLGTYKIKLFGDKAPKTVSNFITLSNEGFYNNLIFHRVIDGFMIQGGDPQGTGKGGPGYQFEDEFDSSLTFSKPGLLAMANSGPSTNGSQFFITVAPTTHLNNKHTIFGEVSEGYDVVEKISKVDKDTNDKPKTPVIIESISII